MDNHKSPSPSLSEAKKQRQLVQNDATLLNNRIKLLQIEEEKTWKKIEEMKKRQKDMEELRKRNSEIAKFRQDFSIKKERNRIENSIKISRFKEELESQKKKNLETISENKKKTHAEVREIREKSMRDKYQMYFETVKQNQKRSNSVKLDHKRQTLKFRRLEQSRDELNRQDYMRRVSEEESLKRNFENKVIEMEVLEMDLIKKLQDTQIIQARTLSELEATIKNKSFSGAN